MKATIFFISVFMASCAGNDSASTSNEEIDTLVCDCVRAELEDRNTGETGQKCFALEKYGEKGLMKKILLCAGALGITEEEMKKAGKKTKEVDDLLREIKRYGDFKSVINEFEEEPDVEERE
jgi:hypothetical protein